MWSPLLLLPSVPIDNLHNQFPGSFLYCQGCYKRLVDERSDEEDNGTQASKGDLIVRENRAESRDTEKEVGDRRRRRTALSSNQGTQNNTEVHLIRGLEQPQETYHVRADVGAQIIVEEVYATAAGLLGCTAEPLTPLMWPTMNSFTPVVFTGQQFPTAASGRCVDDQEGLLKLASAQCEICWNVYHTTLRSQDVLLVAINKKPQIEKLTKGCVRKVV